MLSLSALIELLSKHTSSSDSKTSRLDLLLCLIITSSSVSESYLFGRGFLSDHSDELLSLDAAGLAGVVLVDSLF